MKSMHTPRNPKTKQFIMMECPFGCSHHTFPNHFNFCPYCGSKLVNNYNKMREHTENDTKYERLGNKRSHKKDPTDPFPELSNLLKEA